MSFSLLLISMVSTVTNPYFSKGKSGDIPTERMLTGGFTKRKSDFTTVTFVIIIKFQVLIVLILWELF